MDWHELARAQHGVLLRRQLDALGMTEGQFASLRRRGDLVPDPRRRGLWQVAGAVATADSDS